MADTSDLRYIEPEVVAQLITGPQKDTTVVLDVRDEDFEGGHVKGAVNVPSESFVESVDKFIETGLQGKEKVVVHCQLSQKRGPRCAAVLKQRLAELGLPQSVVVMKGGFSNFGARYGSDPALVATDHQS